MFLAFGTISVSNKRVGLLSGLIREKTADDVESVMKGKKNKQV